MMIPKSIAPKLSRLASTSKIFIIPKAKSKHKGITEATTKPLRQLPKRSTTTKITIRKPRIRFSLMVKVVFAMSSLRSRKALIYTPSGSVLLISSTRSFTASITLLVLASLSIITCPSTFSPWPLPVIAPKRVA